MNRIWFKMAQDVVTLTIMFEITPKKIFVFIIFLMLIIDHQNECTSRSNQIIMNIGPGRVLLIHCHKGIRSVAANDPIPFKLQLDLVAFIFIHYLRVDILYFWMKRERHYFTWYMENKFFTFILKDIFEQNSPRQMEFPRNVIWFIWEFS